MLSMTPTLKALVFLNLLGLAASAHAAPDTYRYHASMHQLRVTAPSVDTPTEPVAPSEQAPPPATKTQGVLVADTSTDFGTLVLGGSASRTFTFKNTGSVAASSIFAQVPDIEGLTLSNNTCGTSTTPVSVGAGQTCSVVLTYGGPVSGKLPGVTLAVQGDFEPGVSSLTLAGTVTGSTPKGAWSSSYARYEPLTAADRTIAVTPVGSSVDKIIWMRNVGSLSGLALGTTLSGNLTHFTLKRVAAWAPYTNVAPGNCAVYDGNRSSVCAAQNANAPLYPHFGIIVTYAPKSVGTHSVTITPSNNGGSTLPAAITLSGSAK